MTKIHVLLACAVTAALLPLGRSPAAQDPAARPASAVAGPRATAGPAAVRLEVLPEEVVLPHRYASSQVLITAVTPDGERVDVTRAVEWLDDAVPPAVDGRGRVRMDAAAGTAGHAHTLRFRYEDLEGSLDVRLAEPTDFEPGFATHVQPILTRRGCNMGTCHGSAEGQNGFQLSLRGYDDVADHRALTDDLAGRRFDPIDPDLSLFLLKPTGAVPHEGGKVLDRDEADYRLVRDWIESGARSEEDPERVVGLELLPRDPTLARAGSAQQFRVEATFADGRVVDVTEHAFVESGNIEVVEADEHGRVEALRRGEASVLARYRGAYAATRLFVMGDREGFSWQPQPQNGWIDELVDDRLRSIRANPSPTCTDEEFLRRVTLDLTGLLPTPADVETFVLDQRPDTVKRAEVVDRLLGSTGFVEFWTARWADLLQVHPKYLGDEGAERLHAWLRQQVASNRPYNAFVRDLLASSGSTWDNPPAAYHKIHREPDAAMEATTQLFLGVRFNCNKCHDHPFEKWTQGQHWRMAALFADVERTDVDGRPRMRRAIDAPPGQQAPTVEEIIGDAGAVDPERAPVVRDPNGRSHRPAFPFEHAGARAVEATGGGGDSGVRSAAGADGETYRARLAEWLTAPENPLFAKSYVNRVWSYLLGRGLIEPVDDIRAGNPPSHPELLDRLTREFVASGFDVRALIRTICRSRTYQRSVVPNEWNADDTVHYARALPRRLPAEVLYDAVHQATGSTPRIPGRRPGTRARDLVDPTTEVADGFLGLFGRPQRESVCECEREDGLSLGQALSMVNGSTFAEAIRDPANELSALARYERSSETIARELYLRFLGRSPSDEELAQLGPTLDPLRHDNLAALPPDERRAYDEELAAWAAGIRIPEWTVAELGTVRARSGAPFERLDDGSVRAAGDPAETDEYTVSVWTDAWPVTGIRLEVLPDGSYPKQGPGRAGSGNFVLSHLRADLVPLGDVAAARTLALRRATADFSQANYPAQSALTPANDGWAIHPRAGEHHELVVEVAPGEDVTPPPGDGGHLVVLHMTFPYGGSHVLGRFRVSLTTSERPVQVQALPEEILTALRTAPGQRTETQQAAIHRRFVGTAAPRWQESIRVAATRDLAWSLTNSPAFLFNR